MLPKRDILAARFSLFRGTRFGKLWPTKLLFTCLLRYYTLDRLFCTVVPQRHLPILCRMGSWLCILVN